MGRAAAAVGAGVATALVTYWAVRRQPWSEHRWSHRVGRGQERFEAASRSLLTWEMHRRSGAWVDPGTPPAVVGQRMLSRLGVGPLRTPEPCEVLDVVREENVTSLHYLALPGHTFDGDERFTVRMSADRTVTFDVAVRSRPVLLLARLAGPFVASVQWLFIARCASALRRAPRLRPAGDR
jgi:uncharacterized protein (UPF0548 family)